MNIIPNSQSLILVVPLAAHTWSKRAIQIIPLIIGLGITTGVGTDVGGIASSASYYQKLSKDLSGDIEQVVKSLVTLQDQVDSLEAVVLQNRRGLGLLTAEKGGIYLLLNEVCYFYVNQSGIVRDMAQQLKELVTKRR